MLNLKSYPFSARLVAIKAPKPDAPPVTSADLFLKIERSKVLDRSATGVMMALNEKQYGVEWTNEEESLALDDYD